MSILTVNSGSTSVKLALYDPSSVDAPLHVATQRHSGHDLEPTALLRAIGAQLQTPPQAVAHRIVHGGTRFVQPTRLDADVIAAIEELSPLAPLHNPVALRWVAAARELWGTQIPQVAVFDTAYFANLPRVAAEYALSARLGVERGVRRYGFHGLAHEAMWHSWCALYPQLPRGGRLITLQLGGGCSMAAIERGRPADTSMGFSPLEGLVMTTRSGDLDAAVVPYLQRQLALTGDEVVKLLNTESGLAGVSGAGAEANPAALLADPSAQAQFAVELYCYRIRKYLGAYLAVLGGCDGIVFGGGVGEHVAGVRSRALAGLAWAGVVLDPILNEAARGGDARVSAAAAPIKVHVISVDEELVLARAAASLAHHEAVSAAS
jgi:acetate kinase